MSHEQIVTEISWLLDLGFVASNNWGCGQTQSLLCVLCYCTLYHLTLTFILMLLCKQEVERASEVLLYFPQN